MSDYIASSTLPIPVKPLDWLCDGICLLVCHIYCLRVKLITLVLSFYQAILTLTLHEGNILLDDNSGLYAGTLNIGHDAKRQHRFVESSFRRAHNYSI